MQSIDYYNQNGQKYIQDTLMADMSGLLDKFSQYLLPKGKVLDLGCGSGRDSLWFEQQGYEVVAMDGSRAMVDYCKKIIKGPVIHNTFDDFHTDDFFDGIWACASLLHVKRAHLSETISKFLKFLTPDGYFFMSFKLLDYDYEKEGRIFTNFTEKSLHHFLNQIPSIKIIETILTQDVRQERKDEGWISVIVCKQTS